MPTAAAIVSHVPSYVWAILAFIVVMGLLQRRDQRVSRARLVLLPAVWAIFGAWGVESSFGMNALPLAAWSVGLTGGLLLVKRTGWPGGARHETETQRFFVPGSWLPMALMLTIFVAKFALGMSLALQPALAREPHIALAFSALFGLLGGLFLGRSRNILARATAPRTQLSPA